RSGADGHLPGAGPRDGVDRPRPLDLLARRPSRRHVLNACRRLTAMPASYKLDVARRIVFSKGWGDLTDADVLAHSVNLKANPRFESRFQQIYDFRELTSIRVTSGGVRSVAAHRPFERDARRAMVTSTDEGFGMLRMFASYVDADPDQMRIFRDLGP